MDVDTSNLDETVVFHKQRMKSCRAAIKDLESRIRKYDNLISRGGDGYDVDSLESSNDHARQQIGRFQQEISSSQTQVANTNKMREFLEKKAMIAEGITIDANAND